MQSTTLHFFCGLIGSGKSTLAQKIAADENAVVVSEDAWLSALWPEEVTSLDAYRIHARRVKDVLWPHIADLLARGVTVVLDFPANNPSQRQRFHELTGASSHGHLLHVLDTPIDVCRARLKARNAAGAHPFQPSDADFDLFARYYEPPTEEEGFTLKTWR